MEWIIYLFYLFPVGLTFICVVLVVLLFMEDWKESMRRKTERMTLREQQDREWEQQLNELPWLRQILEGKPFEPDNNPHDWKQQGF